MGAVQLAVQVSEPASQRDQELWLPAPNSPLPTSSWFQPLHWPAELDLMRPEAQSRGPEESQLASRETQQARLETTLPPQAEV